MGKSYPCFTFLGLTFGDCHDEVTTKIIQKSQTEISNEIIANMTKSTISNNSAAAINSVSIRIVGQKDVIFDGVTIKQYAQAKMIQSAAIAEKITNSNEISNMVDKLMSEFVKISSKSAGADRTVSTDTEQQISTIIKNKLSSELKFETVVNCVTSAVNKTSIDIETTGGVIFRAIKIDQVAEVSASCITNILSDITSKIDIPNNLKQKFQQEDTISLETSYTWIMYIVMAIIVLIIVFGGGYWAINMFHSKE